MNGPDLVREVLIYKPGGWIVGSPEHLVLVAIGRDIVRTWSIDYTNDKRVDAGLEGVEKYLSTQGSAPTHEELRSLRTGVLNALDDAIARVVKFQRNVDEWLPHPYRAVAELLDLAVTADISHLSDVMRYATHGESGTFALLGDVVRRHMPSPPAWLGEPPGAEFVKD